MLRIPLIGTVADREEKQPFVWLDLAESIIHLTGSIELQERLLQAEYKVLRASMTYTRSE